MSAGYRFRDRPLQRIMPETLSAMHYVFTPPDRITYHKLDAWVLSYPLEINQVFFTQKGLQRWLPFVAATAILYPPGLEYWEDYRICTDRRCRSDYIIFSPGESAAALLDLCRNPAGFCRFEDKENLLGNYLHQAADLATGGETRLLAVNGVLNLIIDVLLNYSTLSDKGDFTRFISGKRTPALKNISLSERLTRLFNENPAAPFSVDYLAERLHVSRSTLSHRYSQTCGESPMKAIMRLKIGLCRELLSRGLALKDIAVQCGFCDEFHLMKNFRRFTGMTVARYRKSLR